MLLRRAISEDTGVRRYGAMPNYQAMMSQTYGKDAFVTPSRCLSEAFPCAREYDPDEKEAYTVRACETQRLRNVLLEQRKKKNHSLVEWLADANRAGRLLSYHQNLYRFRAGRRMHLYWRDGDQQWFYVVEAGRELETSIEQQGIKPLSVEAKGFLFTFDEEAEIDEIRASTGAFLKRDRIRLASVYFTQQPSGDNSRLKYHSQIGLIGDSSVLGGT